HKVVALVAQGGSVLVMILFTSLFRAVETLGLKIIVIGLTTVLLAICDNVQSTSYKASTMQMVVDKHRQKLVSYEQLTSALVTTLAPIVGGVLFGLLAIEVTGVFELVSEVIVLLIIWRLNFYLVEAKKAAHREFSLVESFVDGLKYLLANKNLQKLLLFAIFANFALSSLEVGLPVIMLQDRHIGAQAYGITDSFGAIGMIVASLLLGSVELRQNYLRLTGKLGLLMTGSFLILALTSLVNNRVLVVLTFSVCMLVIGGALAGINLPYSMYVRTKVDEDKQGRVGSATSALVSALAPVGYAFFGIMFNATRPLWGLLLCALVLLADSLYLLAAKGKS
ncbi:MFS transporter, partial [Lactobacillus sp. XV13L]|nr:MFS transporter [Lactobacillus sp. XV13L]